MTETTGENKRFLAAWEVAHHCHNHLSVLLDLLRRCHGYGDMIAEGYVTYRPGDPHEELTTLGRHTFEAASMVADASRAFLEDVVAERIGGRNEAASLSYDVGAFFTTAAEALAGSASGDGGPPARVAHAVYWMGRPLRDRAREAVQALDPSNKKVDRLTTSDEPEGGAESPHPGPLATLRRMREHVQAAVDLVPALGPVHEGWRTNLTGLRDAGSYLDAIIETVEEEGPGGLTNLWSKDVEDLSTRTDSLERELADAVPYLREIRGHLGEVVGMLSETIRYHGREEDDAPTYSPFDDYPVDTPPAERLRDAVKAMEEVRNTLRNAAEDLHTTVVVHRESGTTG